SVIVWSAPALTTGGRFSGLTLMMTSSLPVSFPSLTVSRSTYVPDVLKETVVVGWSGGVNVTVPGPMNLDHEYVSTRPRGNGSSVALPVSEAVAGRRID